MAEGSTQVGEDATDLLGAMPRSLVRPASSVRHLNARPPPAGASLLDKGSISCCCSGKRNVPACMITTRQGHRSVMEGRKREAEHASRSVCVWPVVAAVPLCHRRLLLLLLPCRWPPKASVAAATSCCHARRLDGLRREQRPHDRRGLEQATACHARVNVLEKIVGMPCYHAQKVHQRAAAQHHCRKRQRQGRWGDEQVGRGCWRQQEAAWWPDQGASAGHRHSPRATQGTRCPTGCRPPLPPGAANLRRRGAPRVGKGL